MTSASQFTGGHQVAIGESITLNHSLNQVTIDGQVFLRAGVLDTVAGYETSLATNPGLGVIVSNTSYTSAAVINYPALRTMVASAGSATYLLGHSSFYKSTALTDTFIQEPTYYNNYTWSNITDMISVPAVQPYVFIACYGPNYSNQYGVTIYNSSGNLSSVSYPYSSAPSGVTYPQYYALASKPDGSLVLGITYSIDPYYNVYKWTPAGGASAPTITSGSMSSPRFFNWSVCASMFIAINAAGAIMTTTDGLAWTSRTAITLPTGIDIGSGSIWGQSALWAHSATATILLVRGSAAPFNWYIVRTTNGINYTVTSFASLGLYPGAVIDTTAGTVSNQTRASWINDAFYIYRDNGSSNMASPAVYKSTDGITWQPSVPIAFKDQAAGTTVSFMGTVNNNTFVLSQGGSSYLHTTLPSTSATHIGLLSSKTNQYVRVK